MDKFSYIYKYMEIERERKRAKQRERARERRVRDRERERESERERKRAREGGNFGERLKLLNNSSSLQVAQRAASSFCGRICTFLLVKQVNQVPGNLALLRTQFIMRCRVTQRAATFV